MSAHLGQAVAVGMAGCAQSSNCGLDVVLDTYDFGDAIVDEEIRGAGVVVPGHADAAGVADRQAPERPCERTVDMPVGHLIGLEPLTGGDKLIGGGVGHRGPPEIVWLGVENRQSFLAQAFARV